MRSLVVLALVLTATRAGAAPAAPPPPFDLAACASDLAPVAANDMSVTAGGETLGPPRVLAAFAHVDADERERTASSIAKRLEHLHARVELDASGMAHEVEIYVPHLRTELDDRDGALTPALELVRAHPCLFGVTDPAHLGAHAAAGQIIIYAPRAAGSIVVAVDPGAGTRLRFSGHFWPVADGTLDIRPEHLRRYLGRKVNASIQTMRRKGGAPDEMVLHDTVAELDLVTDAGPVITCTRDGFTSKLAIFVTLRGLPDGDPVLAELPAPVDPVTGQPIGGAWIMPSRGEPYTSWTPPERSSAAGRTCLALEP